MSVWDVRDCLIRLLMANNHELVLAFYFKNVFTNLLHKRSCKSNQPIQPLISKVIHFRVGKSVLVLNRRQLYSHSHL